MYSRTRIWEGACGEGGGYCDCFGMAVMAKIRRPTCVRIVSVFKSDRPPCIQVPLLERIKSFLRQFQLKPNKLDAVIFADGWRIGKHWASAYRPCTAG